MSNILLQHMGHGTKEVVLSLKPSRFPKPFGVINGFDTTLSTPVTHDQQMFLMVSLFCGWGGGDWGFHQTNFKNLLGVDTDIHARRCHRLNFPCVDVQPWDIMRISGQLILNYLHLMKLNLDFLLMACPCQGISIAGECNPFHPLNLCFLKSIRMIGQKGKPGIYPKIFLIENVDNLVHGKMQIFYNMVLDELEKLTEYYYDVAILNALHYGAPTDRSRSFIIGIHKSLGVMPSFPEPDIEGAEKMRIKNILPEIDGLLYGYGFDKLKGKDDFAGTVTKTPNLMALKDGQKIRLEIFQMLKLCGYPVDWKYIGYHNLVWNR